MSAFELGLPPAHGAAIFDTAIPPLLPEGSALVGRDPLLTGLKASLRAVKSLGLVALGGLPGVGKTSLAVALARDQEVRAHFPAGILWVGLGPQPNVLGLLSRWSAPGAGQGVPDRRGLGLALRSAIGDRRLLMVIDDAWSLEHANVITGLMLPAFERGLHGVLGRAMLDFVEFLDARGMYGQAEMHLLRAGEATRELGAAAALTSIQLHLGRSAQKQGAYDKAEEHYRQGLALAREIGQSR